LQGTSVGFQLNH